jgi:hypothetical protein
LAGREICSVSALQTKTNQTNQQRKEIKMKHLNLELEKLEQRIAPGDCCCGGSGSSGSKSGGSDSGGSKSGGSDSGGSESGGSKSS